MRRCVSLFVSLRPLSIECIDSMNRLHIRAVSLLLIHILTVSSLWAQLSVPVSVDLHHEVQGKASLGLRSLQPIYSLQATTRASEDDLRDCSGSTLRLLRLPVDRYTQLPTPDLWGAWNSRPSGQKVWRGALSPERAGWHTLFFSHYHLAPGDLLLITDEEGRSIRGAFTDQNNVASQTLVVAPLYAEQVWVHYYPASGEEKPLPWQLESITTALRGDLSEPIGGAHHVGEPFFTIKGIECADATILHPEVGDIAQSTLIISVRGRSFGSATLLNNGRRDGAPIVLTAAHVLNDSYKHSGDLDYVRESAEQTIFFFNYASPTGSPLINGITEQSLSGAELLAYDENYDLCLLKITGVRPDVPEGSCAIPPSYMPYFAGWNAGDFDAPVVSLHHPNASVRRYSMSVEKPTLQDYNIKLPVSWKSSHWLIKQWDHGTTAPGSSGSGLFDSKQRVIGALSGGSSYCHSPYMDYYFALSRVYHGDDATKRLAPHLDPERSGISQMGGFKPFAQDPPHRLSYQLYDLFRDSVSVRDPLPTVSAIAIRYDLDTMTELLGLVGVLDRIDEWQDLVLQVFSDREGAPDQLIEEYPLSRPSYLQIDGTQPVATQSRERTMISPFQSFFTLPSPLSLPRGSYFFALRAADGSDLKLPILLSKAESHRTPVSYEFSGGSWHPTSIDGKTYLGHYWIDPVLSGHLSRNVGVETFKGETPQVSLLGQSLLILLPTDWLHEPEPARLSVYHSSGVICGQQTLDRVSNVNVVDLSTSSLSSGVYIITVTHGRHLYSTKVVYP